MSEGPLVSVVTPSYNMSDRLLRCIESIEAQSYPRVEHLVIDGGSTDGTLDILQAHPDLRWVSEPDEGQSNALNKGFRLAEGELLTWINADDTLNPEAVKTIVEAYARTGAELIYGNCVMWEGERSHLWDPPPSIDETSFDWICPIAQQGTFFSKRAFELVGGIDESYDLAMDFDLWLRFLAAGVRTASVPDVLGTFEVHDESKTGSRGRDEFLREGAIALRRRGRRVASDVMVGRAAAERAAETSPTGPRVRTSEIKRELAAVKSSSEELADVEERNAMRGAFAEAARIEVRLRRPYGHLAALRHLLRPEPWADPLTRSSARGDLKVAIARVLDRVGVR
jgi:Glycosyl transferase family 2